MEQARRCIREYVAQALSETRQAAFLALLGLLAKSAVFNRRRFPREYAALPGRKCSPHRTFVVRMILRQTAQGRATFGRPATGGRGGRIYFIPLALPCSHREGRERRTERSKLGRSGRGPRLCTRYVNACMAAFSCGEQNTGGTLQEARTWSPVAEFRGGRMQGGR
jgi:hypothetical protein